MQEHPADREPALAEARAMIREELVSAATRMASEETPLNVGDHAFVLESLANAYTTLGGDLELAPSRSDALERALARLNEQGRELAVEDFPERLQPFARAANDVLKAAAR